MTSRLAAILKDRSVRREAVARAVSTDILTALSDDLGLDASLTGSLSRGGFKLHSDIDILIRGEVGVEMRAKVDRIISRALRRDEISRHRIICETIYLADFPRHRHEEFEQHVRA